MRTALLVASLALAGCAASAPPPTPALDCGDACPLRTCSSKAPPADRRGEPLRINVDVDGVDLSDVCEQIGALVGRNIVVDPNLQEVVTVRLKEIPWREAVEVIAKMNRCRVEERPGGVLLLTSTCVRVTLCFDDADVRILLQLVAAYAEREILLPPALEGVVSGSFSGSTESVMTEILSRARLPYDVVWGHPIRLRPKKTIPLEPTLFELRGE